ncbi:MAG: thioredoxin domain-containing protein [Planctomycetota bacterium]
MVRLDWIDWDQDPLERASREDRIILLFLVAAWCRFSKEMEETTFSDLKVIASLKEGFLPVRVDADRRPDLDSRYNMGGWPSIAFLSPEGNLIAGENYMTARELLPFLAKVKDYYRKHRDEIRRGVTISWSQTYEKEDLGEGLDRELVDGVVASMLEKFDHRYGGWGQGQKFAHPESIDFAMVQYVKTGDHRMKDVVVKTLDNMMEGGIHDVVEGGFFRFSTTRDWRVPHFEKVLDNNAMRLRYFLEAYQIFNREAYRKTAEGIVRWLTTTMLDPETGAFYGSQGDDPDYYALDAEERGRREAPLIDRTVYCNWNAMAIGSLLKASVVFDREDLRDIAMKALSFLLKNLYFDKEGMYHYWDGTYHLPQVLSDQAYMIQALVIASQFVGDADLLLPAEHLAELLLETHRAEGGGFYDLPESVRRTGALRKRNRSILENAVLAEALTRLSYLSRRPEFREVARGTLLAFTRDYKEYGYFVAGYARAVDLFLYEPLVVTVVGDRKSDLAKTLRRAAQSLYLPSRIVQTLDPAYDPILIGRSGLEPSTKSKAYLSLGRKTLGCFGDPEALVVSMRQVEAGRREGS